MSSDWLLYLVLAVSVALVGLILWLVASGRTAPAGRGAGRHQGSRRPHRNDFRSEDDAPAPPRRRAAIVLNPTKFDDLGAVRSELATASERLGWDEPLVLLTTVEDPGTGQARHALAEGVDVVCALGGDGTIRAVATALVGSETPMGLLPRGTGNLLARNLEIPVDRIASALEVAYTGKNRRIDVGWAALDEEGERRSEDPGVDTVNHRHIFLVMAGLGFDAAVMSGTTETAKARVGWPAYVATGMRHLGGPSFKARVRVDLEPELGRRTRSVIIGNCGRLTGGITLMPDARIDDGVLDAVILSPQGIVGWGAVAAQVLTKRHKGHERLERRTGREIVVETDSPEEVELDGDVIGEASRIQAWVEPHALVVRVEATASAATAHEAAVAGADTGAGGTDRDGDGLSTGSSAPPARAARTGAAR